MASTEYDAVVVGAGPNGLGAAVELARNGKSVLVLEAAETIGGGTRTAELTLPGFAHDVCSAVHPMGQASPFFTKLPLADFGLEWVHPTIPLAHPFDDGTAALLHRSVDTTSTTLGVDADAYRRVMNPMVGKANALIDGFLSPILRVPRHPFVMLGLLRHALKPATKLAHSLFSGDRAKGLFGGNAVHAILPLDQRPTGAFGLVYGFLGHAFGWPFAKGGSKAITDALGRYLWSIGGRIECNHRVGAFNELPPARSYLFDLTPRQLLEIAGDQLSSGYARRLSRFRHGPGLFKIDWALDGPIPWTAQGCADAGTLHLVGSFEESVESEAAVARGEHPQRPWVILSQPTLFDPSRAPEGKHTAWAYCHVPHGSTVDMTAILEDQVERFAPGFNQLVIGRSVKTAYDLHAYNENYIGGDITCGVADIRQLVFRPVAKTSPWSTPHPGIYICSSSTPPGPAVHGMCGYYAARAVLDRLW